jgi:Protein of unknown function (DUF2442)
MGKKFPESIPVPPMTEAMYRAALKSAKRDEPLDVIEARYDRKLDALELTLRKGITVRFPRLQIWELADKSPDEVAEIEIQPGGDGLSFPRTDVDIYVPGLLREELGTLFARALGRSSRGRTSPKKAASSKANGKKGGRPKKTAA